MANKMIRELLLGNAKRISSFPRDAQLPPAPVDVGQIMLSVRTVLTDVCDIVGKPVVVFFDEVDCLVVEENKTPHNWKNPVWHHADGSVAEW